MLTLVTGGARSGKSDFAEKLVMQESAGEAAVYIATSQAFDEEMRERIGLHRRMREASGFAWRTVEEPHELSALLSKLGNGSGGSAPEHDGQADGGSIGGAGRNDRQGRADVGAIQEEARAKPDARAGRESGGGKPGVEAGWEGAESGMIAGVNAPDVLVDCLTLWLSNRLLTLEHEPERDRLLQDEAATLVQAAAAYPGRLTLVTNEVGSGLVPEYALGRLFRDWAGRLNRQLAERAERVFFVACGIPVELKSLQYRMGSGSGGVGQSGHRS